MAFAKFNPCQPCCTGATCPCGPTNPFYLRMSQPFGSGANAKKFLTYLTQTGTNWTGFARRWGLPWEALDATTYKYANTTISCTDSTGKLSIAVSGNYLTASGLALSNAVGPGCCPPDTALLSSPTVTAFSNNQIYTYCECAQTELCSIAPAALNGYSFFHPVYFSTADPSVKYINNESIFSTEGDYKSLSWDGDCAWQDIFYYVVTTPGEILDTSRSRQAILYHDDIEEAWVLSLRNIGYGTPITILHEFRYKCLDADFIPHTNNIFTLYYQSVPSVSIQYDFSHSSTLPADHKIELEPTCSRKCTSGNELCEFTPSTLSVTLESDFAELDGLSFNIKYSTYSQRYVYETHSLNISGVDYQLRLELLCGAGSIYATMIVKRPCVQPNFYASGVTYWQLLAGFTTFIPVTNLSCDPISLISDEGTFNSGTSQCFPPEDITLFENKKVTIHVSSV